MAQAARLGDLLRRFSSEPRGSGSMLVFRGCMEIDIYIYINMHA